MTANILQCVMGAEVAVSLWLMRSWMMYFNGAIALQRELIRETRRPR